MRILASDLIGVPVRTESGETLGKLTDLVLDADGFAATHIAVSKSSLLAKILPSEFHIHVAQVVSVSSEVVVVRDGAVEEESVRSAVIAAERAASAGVSHRVAMEG